MKIREINLLDLLADILLQWRKIIVFMLAGAIFFAGFGYLRAQKTYSEQKTKAEQLEARLQELRDQKATGNGTEEVYPERQWLEEQLSEDEIADVNAVITAENYCAAKEFYREQSILMKMDAMKVSTAELTFHISADEKSDAYDIQKVYEDLMTSGDLYEYIEEHQDELASEQIRELISLEKSSYSLITGTDIVRVVVIAEDERNSQILTRLIVDFAEEQHERLKDTLGDHAVELLNESYTEVYRTDILKSQKDTTDEIASLNGNIRDRKAAFTEGQWQFYNYLTSGVATGMPEGEETICPETAETINSITDELTELNKMQKPGVSLKYIVMGMILAALLCASYYALKYIFETKLRSTDNLQELYEIPELGRVLYNADSKKRLKLLDRKILKIRNYGKRQFSVDETMELAIIAIKMAAERKELQKISMVGCGMTAECLAICKQIIDRLGEQGVEVELLSNILYDAASLQKLTEVKGAVLVGIVGESFYSELLEERELLDRLEIEKLGIVLIG